MPARIDLHRPKVLLQAWQQRGKVFHRAQAAVQQHDGGRPFLSAGAVDEFGILVMKAAGHGVCPVRCRAG